MKMFSRLLHAAAICVTAALGVSTAKATNYTGNTEFSSATEVGEASSVTGGSTADSPVVFSATNKESGLSVTTGNMTLNSGYWDITSGTYYFASDLILAGGVFTVKGGNVSTEWWLPMRGGSMVVDGGTVTIPKTNTGRIVVAQLAKNTSSLTVKSGTVTVNGLLVGADNASATSYITVEGGTVTVHGDFYAANTGTGTLVVGGGSTEALLNLPDASWASITRESGATGTVILKENGTLACPFLQAQNSDASKNVLTFDGGTIRKTRNDVNSGEYLLGTSDNLTVTVTGNGGTIETGGFDITIAAAITGSGTLNITGGGSVTFTTAPTCKVATTDGTTVTGATLLTAVSVTAPSSDWSSKTLPIAAYAKTMTEGWAVYANGGSAASQKLGDRTAYVAVVDGGSLETPPALAGVAVSTSGNTFSGFDAYTVLDSGTVGTVYGGCIVTSGKHVTISDATLLTQVQGNAVAENVFGAGHASSYSGTLTGNAGIVILGNAQVSGSIVGAWVATGTRAGTLNGNSSILVKSLQSTSSSTTFGDTGYGSSTGYIVGGGVVKDTACNWETASMTGDTSVVIDLPSTAEGSFVKAIVGGTAQLRNHSNSHASALTGNTVVEISAPNAVTFANAIIGGGYGVRHTSSVSGNSSVTINGGTYTGTIYAGGYGASYAGPCSVGGTAMIKLNGGVFNGATLLPCGKTDSVTGDSILAINGDVDLSNSTVGGFAKLRIGSGVTVTISSSQVEQFENYGATVQENSGVYTATASYRWAGADNANWSEASNWTIGGETAAAAPTADDPVIFPSDCTVNVDSTTCCAKQLVANASVTFVGNPICVTSGVSGSGSITLGNGAGISASQNISVDVDLAITADSDTPAIITTTVTGIGCTLAGALSGSGHVKFTGTEATYHKLTSSGNSGFTGTIELENQVGTFVPGTANACANANWVMDSVNLSQNFTGNGKNTYKSDADKPVYEFGTLSGTVTEGYYNYRYPVIYAIGSSCGEGDEFSLTYTGFSSSGQRFRRPFIRKVGAGTLKLTGTSVGKYFMNEGVLEMVNSDVPSVESSGNITWATSCDSWRSLVFNGGILKLSSTMTSDPSRQFGFTDGTTAILDDGGVNRTFATAIGYVVSDTDSTTGSTAGFTKKGSGTLTLSAAPAYTGATTVEAGALILPTGSSYTLGTDTVVDSSYTDGIKLVPATSMTATVGGVGYATLAAAVAAATADDTVVLCQDVTLTESIAITSSDVTLDLAGHNISIGNGTDEFKAPFYVQGVKFTVTNSSETASAITELVANYGPIMAFGVTNADAANGKTTEVVIGANVTVSGWAGVFVNTYASSYASYVAENDYANIKVTINGTAIGRTDNYEGTGVGVYVNGNCTNTTYPVTLTVNGTATGTGGGVYAAGYTVTTIGEGATLTGGECGIEQRAGSLTINGGAISSTAQTYSAVSNGSGSSVVGAAVAINQHNTGLGVALTINGGTFSGPQAVSITDTESQGTDNVTASITGGTFTSTTGDADITTVVPAVSGGTFSKTVAAAACAAGFVPVTTADSSGKYTVETGLMITEGSLLGKKLTITDTSFFPTECDTTAEQAVYLNTVQANGYYGWQNYVMNADGTTVLAPTYPASGTTITLAPSFGTARTGAGVGVAYTYETSTDGSTWTSSDATIDTDTGLTAGTQKFFRIKATFSAE